MPSTELPRKVLTINYLIRMRSTVISLPVVSLGDRFCFKRKGGTREVGGCTQRLQTAWLSLVIDYDGLIQ